MMASSGTETGVFTTACDVIAMYNSLKTTLFALAYNVTGKGNNYPVSDGEAKYVSRTILDLKGIRINS